jgi:hypothetical protein
MGIDVWAGLLILCGDIIWSKEEETCERALKV